MGNEKMFQRWLGSSCYILFQTMPQTHRFSPWGWRRWLNSAAKQFQECGYASLVLNDNLWSILQTIKSQSCMGKTCHWNSRLNASRTQEPRRTADIHVVGLSERCVRIILQIKLDTPVPLKPRICRAGSMPCKELQPVIVLTAALDRYGVAYELGLVTVANICVYICTCIYTCTYTYIKN